MSTKFDQMFATSNFYGYVRIFPLLCEHTLQYLKLGVLYAHTSTYFLVISVPSPIHCNTEYYLYSAIEKLRLKT